ncbi:MAG TPA: ArsR family transcriptional regulator [Chthoniobacterales bacterium]|nr:ArsR family transcriptional regulator [Chthoniobacterales bacterium]
MNDSPWRKRLIQSTRGQILTLLRQRDRTVGELATELQLTDNAVRAHLMTLERDGFVGQAGTRAGSRRPHALFTVTGAVEHVFPKSYGRLLDLVLGAIARRLGPRELGKAMREVGREIAGENMARAPARSHQQRIELAVQILSELGGAATVERVDGTDVIRGRGCPIAAATAKHPEACLIAESLLSEIIGVPVKERCQRGTDPSCCFEIRRSS